jgi:Dual specificity phosphatase, catalytic domain
MTALADLFQVVQVDDGGRLFISPAFEHWAPLAEWGIDVVIDLEGGLDACIPTHTNNCLYIYFPITDDNEEEPPMPRLRAIARLAAALIREGHRVLSHCGMGFNRSALVAGLILMELGMPGPEAVERLRERRPGALFNDKFAEVLCRPVGGYEG